MSIPFTNVDTAVVKKINVSKTKMMTGKQLENALNNIAPVDINNSITFLLTNQVLVSSVNRTGETAYKVKVDGGGASGGPDLKLLSMEQKLVFGLIVPTKNKVWGVSSFRRCIIRAGKGVGSIQLSDGDRINIRNLRNAMISLPNGVTMTPTLLRKMLTGLEKGGYIKSFTAINAPTVPLYHAYTYEPDPLLIGGFFYNPQTKSLDTDLIQRLQTVCLGYVRSRTLPQTIAQYDAHRNRASGSRSKPGLPAAGGADADDVHNYPLIPVMKRRPVSPGELLKMVLDNGVVPNCTVDAIMQVMRSCEMEGYVERIKPIGGVALVDGIGSDGDDDDDEPGPSKRRRTGSGSDSDDSDAERKARAKAKLKRQKQKEKERAEAKEKEKEKARKKKEKEKIKRREKKEKEKAKKRKEKERKKRKRDETPASGSDSDALRAIDDSPNGKKSKSKSKSSSKSKRKRHASSESDLESDSASSSSDSDSDLDSGSASDASEASSVNSEDIDKDEVDAFRLASANGANGGVGGTGDDGPVGIKDLRDTQVAYRAVRPYSFGFGFGEMPCGKCPVFSFCQEGGPVNATECTYIEKWLTGDRGGWTNEAELREQKELRERTARAEAEAREQERIERAEREKMRKMGVHQQQQHVGDGEDEEEEGMDMGRGMGGANGEDDEEMAGAGSGREAADEGWD